MKFKLTPTEAHNIIRKFYNLPDEVEIVIQSKRKSPVLMNLLRMIEDISRMAYTSHEKISAIKRFRETVNSGLAEAKWAVEHWNDVVTWIQKNRRAPQFTGVYGTGTLEMI